MSTGFRAYFDLSPKREEERKSYIRRLRRFTQISMPFNLRNLRIKLFSPRREGIFVGVKRRMLSRALGREGLELHVQ